MHANGVAGGNGNNGNVRATNVYNFVTGSRNGLVRFYIGCKRVDYPANHANNLITALVGNGIGGSSGHNAIRSSVINGFRKTTTRGSCGDGHVNNLVNNASSLGGILATAIRDYAGCNGIFARVNYHANKFVNRSGVQVVNYTGRNTVLNSICGSSRNPT